MPNIKDGFLNIHPKVKKSIFYGIYFKQKKYNNITEYSLNLPSDSKNLKDLFQEIFTENNITAVASPTNGFIFNFVLCSDNTEVQKFISEKNVELSIDCLGNEGYIIATSQKDDRIIFDICGKSLKALAYALNTIKQVIYDEGSFISVPKMQIIDFPSNKERGIVEGFFGVPWSHESRLSMIEFERKNKMNSYWYAPKDDPYHRDQWHVDYPAEKFNQLLELIEQSNKNYVDFIFSVSPGLSMKFSDEKQFEILCKKYDAIADHGVRRFALMLDDIPRELLHEEDRKVFDNYGSAHAFLANKLYNHLKTKYNAELTLCPTEYLEKEDSLYRQMIKKELNQEITVIWTGIQCWSEYVTRQNTDMISGFFGHKMLLWDNYPVNDAANDRERMIIAPLMNREYDLYESNFAGVIANPMNQSEASKLPLLTTADWMWNPEKYDPKTSWDEAIRRIGGKAGYRPLKLFAENSMISRLYFGSSWHLQNLTEDFWEKRQVEKLMPLVSYLTELKNLKDDIYAINNDKFCAEISPWIDKTSNIASLALDLINAYNLAWPHERKEAFEKVEKRWENFDKYYVVCNRTLDNFIISGIQYLKNNSWLFV